MLGSVELHEIFVRVLYTRTWFPESTHAVVLSVPSSDKTGIVEIHIMPDMDSPMCKLRETFTHEWINGVLCNARICWLEACNGMEEKLSIVTFMMSH